MLRAMLRTAPTLAALVLAGALALAGCSREHATATGAGVGGATTSARVDAAGGGSSPVVMPATPAELLRIVRQRGAPVTLVNVWATWCAPCREEMPDLLETARRHPDVRLVLVSADFDDRLADVRRFLVERGVSGTTYIKSGSDEDFIDAFHSGWTGSIPATFVYDAGGREVAFWEGRADRARFEDAIRQARAARP